jgi:cellulose synthase/poly-beta-1,6-N-acetylglucosamine synthase-like glycosyltransferase
MAKITFWFSVVFIFYVYVGYPMLLYLSAKLMRRSVRKQPIAPNVTAIIAAYNEEHVIGERIENLLLSDYPKERLQIVIASDGSTDETLTIAQQYESEGLAALSLPRRGKSYAIKEAVMRARGDILVFSDANTMFDSHTISRLVENFADPEVGGVAGAKVYSLERKGDSSGRGEKLYWQYDTWLKSLETMTGSAVSADGAVYAIRRELFTPVTTGSDDAFISTGIVAQGKRLVFEPRAVAHEPVLANTEREFDRKSRIAVQGLHVLWARRALLNPFRYGFYSIVLLSHKVLRRIVPYLFLLLLVSSIVAASCGGFYATLSILQLLFYALAGLGFVFRRAMIGRLFYVPCFFCMANLAMISASIRFLKGHKVEHWQPQRHIVPVTARPGSGARQRGL